MRKFLLMCAGLMLAIPAHAQNRADLTGKWDLQITNAFPPNGQGAATEFTFDVVSQSKGNPNAYVNTNLTDRTLTNSMCVAAGMGSPTELDSGVARAVTGTIGVDNGESYTLTGTLSSDKTTIIGTVVYVSKGLGCGSADNGMPFTAYRYQPATGTYSGSFTPDAGGSGFNATVTLTEDSLFNLTGTVTASGNPCFSNLTVDSSVAPSLASGNTLEFYGTDSYGDVIGFIANAGGSSDTPGDITMSNLFVTAAAYSGSCNGQTFTDAPFQKTVHKGKRRHHMKELPLTIPPKNTKVVLLPSCSRVCSMEDSLRAPSRRESLIYQRARGEV